MCFGKHCVQKKSWICSPKNLSVSAMRLHMTDPRYFLWKFNEMSPKTWLSHFEEVQKTIEEAFEKQFSPGKFSARQNWVYVHTWKESGECC